jgi:SPP1 gp7 family putative phage head morphogenesis protein
MSYLLAVVNGPQLVGGLKENVGGLFWFMWDLESVEALRDTLEARLATAKSYFQDLGVPLRIVNDMLDLGLPIDEIEHADDSFLLKTLVPVELLGQQPETANADARAALAGLPEGAVKDGDREGGRQERYAEVWRRLDRDVFKPHEKRWRSKMRRHFFGIRKEVLQKFDALMDRRKPTAEAAQYEHEWAEASEETRLTRAQSHYCERCGMVWNADNPEMGVPPEHGCVERAAAPLTAADIDALLTGRAKWEKELRKFSKPLYQQVAATTAKVTEAELGGFSVFTGAQDPAVQSFIADRMPKLAEGVHSTLSKGVRSQLLQGISENEDIGLLRQRIGRVFNVASGRALTIARTETGIAMNGVRNAAFRAEGIQQHEWITARDANVRDTHGPLEGSVVKIGEPFANGLKYPQDPSGSPEEIINCRCAAMPVLE